MFGVRLAGDESQTQDTACTIENTNGWQVIFVLLNLVGKIIEIDENAGEPPYQKNNVVPTTNLREKKTNLSAIYDVD